MFSKLFGKLKTQSFDNVIDASFRARYIRIILGGAGRLLTMGPENKVIPHTTKLGSFFVFLWFVVYLYCTIKAFIDGQNVTRTLYQTKLQNYGEGFERISSSVFVTYVMWKLPFHLTGDFRYLQKIVDIDNALEVLGVKVDFGKSTMMVFGSTCAQVLVYCLRALSIFLAFINLEEKLPIERLYQTMYADSLALVVSTYYTYYLLLLEIRYKILNNVLKDMCHRKAWDTINEEQKHAMDLHFSEYKSDRIKSCAKIYSMLFEASATIIKMFGLPLACTVTLCLCNIILYLFYFMEATAAGLFHDAHKYAAFLILIGWQITYSLFTMHLNIYISDRVTTESKHTGTVIHAILNGHSKSPPIKNEAMLFSIQLLHQKPAFSPCGLYTLDYVFFQEIGRTITTFLVVLLQFAMDN